MELGYIQQQYQSLGIQKNAFVALMETIPYRLYPLLCVIMALLVWVDFWGSSVVLGQERAVN